ncbi:hypothetical protein [Geomesophilobacter sediminis]|uniref:Phospholipase C/D domain-containing protein n=1 Tax=Geomesophilobacter sediminis TaxID=2798584 RepID=A0A8J7M2Z1_9BACT|nr:hypothetical protein [Geomesophilobacter sediminis]MBJ6727693.1 hypothetical protein [Geomesophilobacter sediminis]
MMIRSIWTVLAAALLALAPQPASAWHDATHMAVVRAAGLGNYAYLAVGPDLAKEKAGDLEGANHYHNTAPGVLITTEMVLAQVKDYDKPEDASGHLYGAIIASINDYLIAQAAGKYALYPLGYAAHYLGDLSMPFHNTAYNKFNRDNHAANDGVVETGGPPKETTEAKVARLAGEIEERMNRLPPLHLSSEIGRFYRDLAVQIAAIANGAKSLGYAMEDAVPPRPVMTEEEAYTQLAQSAQLLKAIYAATNQK